MILTDLAQSAGEDGYKICFDEIHFPNCKQREMECALTCMRKHKDGPLLESFCEFDNCLCRYAC